MSRTQVLLLFGGESSEHDVSISGARNVFAALDDEKYDVSLGYIDKTGKWWCVEAIDGYHQASPQLVPVLGAGQFMTVPEGTMIKPDVILPILHGKQGEDGTVQGLAALLHIPIAGPSILSASLTMNKDATKRMIQAAGVPVVSWRTWKVRDPRPIYDVIKDTLGETLFVKPSRAGSSVGVNKVNDSVEFDAAIDDAAAHDDMVIIETAIKGREIEVAVLGNQKFVVTTPGEIIPGQEFYSYDDKYASASTAQVAIPAELSEGMVGTIKEHARVAYEAVVGHGMARLDFFVVGDEAFLNEINAIPGFTNISMYPKLWRHDGMSYPQLIDELIRLAIEE